MTSAPRPIRRPETPTRTGNRTGLVFRCAVAQPLRQTLDQKQRAVG